MLKHVECRKLQIDFEEYDVTKLQDTLPKYPDEEARKQWIIMRKDLNMPPGKIGAQAAHASMGALLKSAFLMPTGGAMNLISIPATLDIECWLSDRFTKVMLEVHSEQELKDVADKLEAAGFEVSRIVDSGLTVFDGQPTFTCVGVGPYAPSAVKPYIGRLRLYK